jgi:hypothetical protein
LPTVDYFDALVEGLDRFVARENPFRANLKRADDHPGLHGIEQDDWPCAWEGTPNFAHNVKARCQSVFKLGADQSHFRALLIQYLS